MDIEGIIETLSIGSEKELEQERQVDQRMGRTGKNTCGALVF